MDSNENNLSYNKLNNDDLFISVNIYDYYRKEEEKVIKNFIYKTEIINKEKLYNI